MKFLKALIIIVFLSDTAYGQKFIGLSYKVAAPVGNTSDYIDKISFRGLEAELRTFLTERVSLGGSLGWQAYYESTGEQVIRGEDFALSGKQWRYINSFPLMLTGHYYSRPGGSFQFYGGLGLGIVHNIRRTDVGLYTFEESAWNFGLAPEVGVLVPVGITGDLHFALKYNQSFSGGDIDDDLGALALKLGYVFR